MLIEPIHLPIPSITVLGYQGDHCTCIWLFGTPRFLAAKCQIQKVSPVLNVEAREFQPKIENYVPHMSLGIRANFWNHRAAID